LENEPLVWILAHRGGKPIGDFAGEGHGSVRIGSVRHYWRVQDYSIPARAIGTAYRIPNYNRRSRRKGKKGRASRHCSTAFAEGKLDPVRGIPDDSVRDEQEDTTRP
jgi:hypothetical protein